MRFFVEYGISFGLDLYSDMRNNRKKKKYVREPVPSNLQAVPELFSRAPSVLAAPGRRGARADARARRIAAGPPGRRRKARAPASLERGAVGSAFQKQKIDMVSNSE